MNVLMLYPKFPEQTFWNTARIDKASVGAEGDHAAAGSAHHRELICRKIFLFAWSIATSRKNRPADWEWADVVFLSVMMAQREDYRECVANAKMRGKPIAVGGPFTHALPEAACADADWVCFGEAESIMEQLAGDLRAGRRGRQYQGGSATNMERVRFPRFELLPDINDYATMALQFSRGCPFKCEFCDIIEIYGRVPRTKTPAQVCAELAAVERLGFQGYIFLVDDNFIGNKRKAKDMLAELASWNRRHNYPFRYYTEASINLADDDELLERMFQAGFFHVFIGIETPDPKLLKTTQKMQNIPGNPLAKLAKIRRHGLHVTAGFIVGFDGEERGVFEAQRQFIQASGIGVAMVGLLQAIPHTQLARRLKAEGRLLETLSSTGNHTVEGINFIPKGEMTRREYLEKYRELVLRDLSAKGLFRADSSRLTGATGQGPARRRAAAWGETIGRSFKESYYFGMRAKAIRIYFWKALFQILWKRPAAIESFVFDCAVFHHLHQHADYVQRALAKYLSAPAIELDCSRSLEIKRYALGHTSHDKF